MSNAAESPKVAVTENRPIAPLHIPLCRTPVRIESFKPYGTFRWDSFGVL